MNLARYDDDTSLRSGRGEADGHLVNLGLQLGREVWFTAARPVPERGPQEAEFDIPRLVPHTLALMHRNEHRALNSGASRAVGRLFLIHLVLIS